MDPLWQTQFSCPRLRGLTASGVLSVSHWDCRSVCAGTCRRSSWRDGSAACTSVPHLSRSHV